MKVREGMWGDGHWHLFDILNDPGETNPIEDQHPELLADLIAHYEQHAKDKDIVPVSDNWSPWFGFVDLETFGQRKGK